VGQLNEPPDRRQNGEDNDHVDDHDDEWIVGYGLMHKLTSSCFSPHEYRRITRLRRYTEDLYVYCENTAFVIMLDFKQFYKFYFRFSHATFAYFL